MSYYLVNTANKTYVELSKETYSDLVGSVENYGYELRNDIDKTFKQV